MLAIATDAPAIGSADADRGRGALVAGGASGLGRGDLAGAGGGRGRGRRSPTSTPRRARRWRRDRRRGASSRPTSPTPRRSPPRSSGPRAPTAACASRSAAPGSAGPSGSPTRAAPTTSRYFSNVVKVNLIGSFNVLRLAADAMSANEPDDGGRARGLRQHRLDRRLRRPDRPDRLRRLQGRHRRHDPARRARHGLARRPRDDDRPRPLRHAAARRPARGGAHRARRRHPLPLPPRPPRGVRPHGRSRSSPTRCSTARRSASTAPCGCRRSSSDGRRVRSYHARQIARCRRSVGPLGLGVAPDLLAPGRGDREGRVESVAAIGSSGIRWTRRPGVKRSTSGCRRRCRRGCRRRRAGGRSRGPSRCAARAPSASATSLERADAGVGAPVGDAARVVVAVVRGGALVDARRPAPMRIWTPSQSSWWKPSSPATGIAAQRRRVGVVGPVLDVEIAGARARAVGPVGLGAPPRRRQSTTWTKAVTGRPASVRCTSPRSEPSPQAVLRQRRKSTGTARDPSSKASIGMCSPHQLADLGPVGGDQRRLVAAPVGQRGRAEDPRGDRPRQLRARHPHPRRDQPDQQQRDDAKQSRPTPPSTAPARPACRPRHQPGSLPQRPTRRGRETLNRTSRCS